MSELDTYLLVALFCAVCGFFIGMGQEFMRGEKEPRDPPSDGARIAFSLTNLVGIGYFIAWLWVSHQPLIKLIPVFILAAVGGWVGAGLASARVGTWLPVVGMVLIPATFHGARYFSLI